jgi:hypothetical protein
LKYLISALWLVLDFTEVRAITAVFKKYFWNFFEVTVICASDFVLSLLFGRRVDLGLYK